MESKRQKQGKETTDRKSEKKRLTKKHFFLKKRVDTMLSMLFIQLVLQITPLLFYIILFAVIWFFFIVDLMPFDLEIECICKEQKKRGTRIRTSKMVMTNENTRFA